MEERQGPNVSRGALPYIKKGGEEMGLRSFLGLKAEGINV